jgi:cation diffusion facilitator family transporter
VLVAISANVLIAVAKGVAASVTSSAALWAETLHSIADSGNEVLLLVGLSRSAKQRDLRHPLGYGQERYVWSFLAALGIFVIGGVLSIGEGIRSLVAPEPLTSLWVGIGVLLLAACFEGYSWTVARRQLRRDASHRGRSMTQHLLRASDPSAPTIYLEDTAALAGIALALLALALHVITGQTVWDAAGSMGIGVLLIVVAIVLARRSKALLIDESAPADVMAPIRRAVARPDWVLDVPRLDAVFLGPAQLLVIAQVQLAPPLRDAPAREVARRLELLRAELLQSPAIAELVITVDPGTWHTGDVT